VANPSIDAAMPALLRALETGNAVLIAPPGTGKTTKVPLACLDAGIADRIVVLQPRRIAARMAAAFVARELGETLGDRVGYRVRFDRATSERTRLEFATEGIMVRRLMGGNQGSDPGLVVLDEFHERHLDSELVLNILRWRQRAGRPAPRLLVMSATLDTEPVREFLDAATVEVEGRLHPVEIQHRTPSRRRRDDLGAQVITALAELIASGQLGRDAPPGHALVFLPGVREIEDVRKRCASLGDHGMTVCVLHGRLDPETQDLALDPSLARKVVLATNVAETSLTIEGVRVVLDSGLARIAAYDPARGHESLELRPISRASAAQRAGRAGRTGPGLCIRLYARADHDRRPAFERPEITRLDLASFRLAVAGAGFNDATGLEWFEAPPAARYESAEALVRGLGAIDEGGRLTKVGDEMIRYPLHPRLARLVVEGGARGITTEAATAAALLSQGHRGPRPTELADMDFLDAVDTEAPKRRGPVARARDQIARLTRSASPRSEAPERALRMSLLAAHPDRVGQVRRDADGRETIAFADGGSARVGPRAGVRPPDWIVALEVRSIREGTHTRTTVHGACTIDPGWLVDLFPERIVDRTETRFDPQAEQVHEHSALCFGQLTLETTPRPPTDSLAAARVLAKAIRGLGLGRVVDSAAYEQLRARLAFASQFDASIRPIDDEGVDAWLERTCEGWSRLSELRALDLLGFLEREFSASAGSLDRVAPRHVSLGGGRRVRVEYTAGESPRIGGRIQHFFGSSDGPRIVHGDIAIVMHLKAPNDRDVQVTRDLAGFWERHYPALRKQLMRRYPKHDWPENPRTATPPPLRRSNRRRR
jgi:ATP-dependent helicase HrpB